MRTPIRVLILEDHPADAELMLDELSQGGFEPAWWRAETESEFLALLDTDPCVILADYNLPQFDAPRALRLLQDRGLDIPFIVVSGAIGEETAASIMRQGATDYLLKDRMGRLPSAVVGALEKKRLHEEKRQAEESSLKAEQKYREIFESAIEGICQSTPQGKILALNPTMAQMLGYSSPDEAVPAIQNAGMCYVDSDTRAEHDRLLGEGDALIGFECRLRRRDQSIIWVRQNTRVVRHSSGEVMHYNCTMMDITDLKAVEAAVSQYRQELRDLTGRLLTIQETESKRLGRELHDAFSQKLAILGLELGLLRKHPPPSPEVLEQRLGSLSERISELAVGLHQTARSLHPSVLYDLGLQEALKRECDALAKYEGLDVICTSENVPEGVADMILLCLYRVAQESLWNIRKHAGAREVRVQLRASDHEIVLTIEDDGCGFARDAVRGRGGLGLVSMEERVRLVGGKLEFVSKPGSGTRVEARAPIR